MVADLSLSQDGFQVSKSVKSTLAEKRIFAEIRLRPLWNLLKVHTHKSVVDTLLSFRVLDHFKRKAAF